MTVGLMIIFAIWTTTILLAVRQVYQPMPVPVN